MPMLVLGVVLGLIVSPASAGIETLSLDGLPVLAQVVDSGSVQNKSVGDVWNTMKDLEPYTLAVSMLLVIALLFAGGLLRPGGFAKAGLRDITALPAVVFFFAAFVVLLAQSSGASLVGQFTWVNEQGYSDFQMRTIVSTVSYLLAMIAGFGMLFILRRSATTGDGLDNGFGVGFLDLPVGLGCFLLAFPFIRILGLLGEFAYTQTQGQRPDGIAHETLKIFTDNPNDPWVMVFVGGAIIGAPIVEELVFRVYVQGALLKWFKSPWLSIIFTSILFASIHRLSPQPVPWFALPTIFAVGLTCGVAYERTKRVGVPIMMHMCFNLLNVLIVMMSNADAAPAGV